jgi:hypothetical protein
LRSFNAIEDYNFILMYVNPTKLDFIRKLRPNRFHIIDSRSYGIRVQIGGWIKTGVDFLNLRFGHKVFYKFEPNNFIQKMYAVKK